MADPIRIEAVRWRCPHCNRSRAKRSDVAKHIPTCHRNPEARACSTCAHFSPHPCCEVLSDDCGCKGLNVCAVGAFERWKFNDHDTHAPDPEGWWRHVVDFRKDCPQWEST